MGRGEGPSEEGGRERLQLKHKPLRLKDVLKV